MMTSTCVEACIICDIDGFRGRNDQMADGEAPAGFCTTTVHNGQWIAFIAGSEDLSIRLDVSNCRTGAGLEVAIYEGIGCDNFRMVSNCNGNVRVNTSEIFTANEKLTIGQYYYLVMDGNGGDNCDWVFNVVAGDTRVAPLDTSGELEGDFDTCPNLEQLYQLDFPIGATEFTWELNGVTQAVNAPEIPLTFEEAGIFNLCVTAFNACNAAPPTCRSILVTAIPPTDLGQVKICEGDNYEVADTILNTTGFYRFPLKTADGCDSLVIVEVEAIPSSSTHLGDFNICEEDALPIGDELFSSTGLHSKVLSNSVGCDSTVTLDLFIVICNIQAVIDVQPVRCRGESTGSLTFFVENGTPPFTYAYQRVGGTVAGNGAITALNEEVTITNLGTGTYLITIEDNFGNQRILVGAIQEPDLLEATFNSSNYNNFQVSCFGATDGSLEVFAMGGTPPYSYLWDNGSTEVGQRAIGAGSYSVQVRDLMGCSLEISEVLTAPSPIEFVANFSNPSCDGLSTGEVTVNSILGGIAPYTFNLNRQGFSSNTNYTGLTEGDYQIIAQDANGCQVMEEGVLRAPIIPVVSVGEDVTIELADDIELTPSSLTPLETITWRNNTGLSCYDCLEVTAAPTNRTTYALTVSSIDGCTATDSLSIEVIKVRDVYAPNVFSPNQDGLNDRFLVYGGPEVSSIQSLRIYTRWGEQLFEQRNFPPNDPDFGWTGMRDNRVLGNAVYIWMAEISFIDGETLIYSGDVAIIR